MKDNNDYFTNINDQHINTEPDYTFDATFLHEHVMTPDIDIAGDE